MRSGWAGRIALLFYGRQGQAAAKGGFDSTRPRARTVLLVLGLKCVGRRSFWVDMGRMAGGRVVRVRHATEATAAVVLQCDRDHRWNGPWHTAPGWVTVGPWLVERSALWHRHQHRDELDRAARPRGRSGARSKHQERSTGPRTPNEIPALQKRPEQAERQNLNQRVGRDHETRLKLARMYASGNGARRQTRGHCIAPLGQVDPPDTFRQKAQNRGQHTKRGEKGKRPGENHDPRNLKDRSWSRWSEPMTEPDVCPACPVASSLRYRITGVRHALNHSLKIDLNTKQLSPSGLCLSNQLKSTRGMLTISQKGLEFKRREESATRVHRETCTRNVFVPRQRVAPCSSIVQLVVVLRRFRRAFRLHRRRLIRRHRVLFRLRLGRAAREVLFEAQVPGEL